MAKASTVTRHCHWHYRQQMLANVIEPYFKAMFPLAKFSIITPATGPQDSLYVASFGNHGQCDANRNDPIYVMLPKVAQASTVPCYCLANNLW